MKKKKIQVEKCQILLFVFNDSSIDLTWIKPDVYVFQHDSWMFLRASKKAKHLTVRLFFSFNYVLFDNLYYYYLSHSSSVQQFTFNNSAFYIYYYFKFNIVIQNISESSMWFSTGIISNTSMCPVPSQYVKYAGQLF